MGCNIFEIKKKANNLLLDFGVNKYPINVFEIIDKLDNCKISTYTEYSIKVDKDIREVIKFFGSDDAVIFRKNNNHIIFYNDLNTNKQRILWSIAHEIGHVCLNHLDDSNCKFTRGLTNIKYKQYEKDADKFAAELLSNLCILDKMNIKSSFDISCICYLSKQAATYRYEAYTKWVQNKYTTTEDTLLCKSFKCNYKFKEDVVHPMIKPVRATIELNNVFGYCVNCGKSHGILNPPQYCCICGKNLKLSFKGENEMIYEDGYELDNRGKAKICPVCSNEEMNTGTHCMICGTYLVNKCSSEECGEVASGNARFCEYCGESTTFYINKLLKDYNHIDILDVPF